MRTFHHGNLNSPRLAKLLAYLTGQGSAGATTFDITFACQTTRASSDVSELTKCGVNISTTYEGTNENGRKIYRYTLQPIDRADFDPPSLPAGGADTESAAINL